MLQNKPFAKIGDAMAANDWRFQLRAEDIPRRPPKGGAGLPNSSRLASQSGPDRGFIEQPEERVQTTILPPKPPPPPPPPPSQTLVMVPRRRVVEVAGRDFPPPPPPPPPIVWEPPPPPPTEVIEMAQRKKQREPVTQEFRERAVQMVKDDGQTGAQARVARALGVTEAAISYWVRNPLKKKRGRPFTVPSSSQQTMLSPPSSNGAMSGPVSVGADTLPALPTVQLSGMEEYIRALVKVEVRNELRRRLND